MSTERPQRILYVEDEPDIQEVACLALEAVGGYDVELCSSGQEAVDKGPGFKPDLIMLDVMMPGMDGPTTLEALRKIESLKTTPVVFVTAKVQAHEVNHYLALGAVGVIEKPFDPMTLSDQVAELWNGRGDG